MTKAAGILCLGESGRAKELKTKSSLFLNLCRTNGREKTGHFERGSIEITDSIKHLLALFCAHFIGVFPTFVNQLHVSLNETHFYLNTHFR